MMRRKRKRLWSWENRFAKLLSLEPETTHTAILLNSAEENSSIILKMLGEAYRDDIRVNVRYLDLDFEHQEG